MTRPSRLLEVVVFVVGASSLGAEIAAARLLAPWFGASTIVWANTIATVLVALSIGYALGGRAADRDPTLHGLARIVLASAVLMAIVPFLADPFLRLSVDAFDKLSVGVFAGSLVGVSVLIAVPVLLLGMASPYAVRLRVEDVADAGRATGRLYAISTVGSLTGTFLAALLLIPLIGTRRTFLTFALALGLVSVLGLSRRRLPALVVPVVVIALIALPVGTLKSQTASGKVIWERETEYQYARVIQDASGERTLELNEGQAVHSVYRPGSVLVGGYWDEMSVLPFTAKGPVRRVAILGSAAGTTARAISHFHPEVRVDAVEIDGQITDVGRRLFGLKGKRLHTYAQDARPWLESSKAKFDTIEVDAYRQPYIPFYLTTEEFFSLARDRLTPGGVVAVNVGHPKDSPQLEKVLTATMASVFGRTHVWRDPVSPTNTMLLATTDDADPASRLVDLAPADLGEVAGGTAQRLARGLPGGRVYTDDLAPVEWLVDFSLAHVAETHDR